MMMMIMLSEIRMCIPYRIPWPVETTDGGIIKLNAEFILYYYLRKK